MNSISCGDEGRFASEEARIRTAYARRREWEQAPDARGVRPYSLFDVGQTVMVQSLERNLLDLLRKCGVRELAGKKILDIGCGSGAWLAEFIRFGAEPGNLAGIDLIEEHIARARNLLPTGVRFDCCSAADLPFASQSFDLVSQFTAFSSILDKSLMRSVAREMERVVRPTGAIIWYDFRVNNPRNPDVKGIGHKEIKSLFPNCAITLRSITLAPPLCRRLSRYSAIACDILEKISSLRTHYVGVFVRNSISL